MNVPNVEHLLADLGWLRQLARRLVHDPQEVEDLVQDTWAVALQQQKPPRQWRPWLTRVLQNLWHSRRRHRTLARRHAEALVVHEEIAAASAVQRAEAQRRVVDAVMVLEEPYRSTILLRFFDEMPPRRIAAHLQVPVATVNSRLQRALQQLRRALNQTSTDDRGWRSALLAVAWPEAASSNATAVPPPAARVGSMRRWLGASIGAAAVAAVAWWGLALPGGAPASQASLPLAAPGEVLPRRAVDEGTRQQVPVAAAPASAPQFRIVGHAVDCDGRAVPGVAVVFEPGEPVVPGPCPSTPIHPVALPDNSRSDHAGTAIATTASDGAFAACVSADRGVLRVSAAGYATVVPWSWSAAADDPALVVVAPRIAVSGHVVDSNGQPVRRGVVCLAPPADLAARLGRRLDRAVDSYWESALAADGSFSLPFLPVVAGGRLQVSADGWAPHALPAPQRATPDLLIVLPTAALPGTVLAGSVVFADGRPAAGARVALGVTSAVADRQGQFRLSLLRAGPAGELVAASPGFLPARLSRSRGDGQQLADWPAAPLLVLGARSGVVVGRVVDQQGQGIGGAEVWIGDATPFGVDGLRPVLLEAYLAGAPAWTTGQPEEPIAAAVLDAPTSGNRRDQFLREEPRPSVTWNFVTTDASGRFELAGLMPRDYELHCFDGQTGCLGRAAAVRAGEPATLVVDRDMVLPELPGRVMSGRGRPIAGVRAEVRIVTCTVAAPTAGGRCEWVFLRRVMAAASGPDGAFLLRRVPRHAMVVWFEGDGVVPDWCSGEGLEPGGRVDVTLDQRCAIDIRIADAAEADAAFCVDEAGEPQPIFALSVSSTLVDTIVPLVGGRSGPFTVADGVVAVVLTKQGRPVRRIPVVPDPGRTTLVQ